MLLRLVLYKQHSAQKLTDARFPTCDILQGLLELFQQFDQVKTKKINPAGLDGTREKRSEHASPVPELSFLPAPYRG